MSAYWPPLENLPTFDVTVFRDAQDVVDYAVATGTANNIAGGTAGDLLYQSAPSTTAKLPIGANTYVLTSNGSTPTWSAPATPTTPNLSQVLAAGNSAGAYSINMNTRTITNASSISATTFTGALSGNATTATTATYANQVNITRNTTNNNFSLVFAVGIGTAYNGLQYDDSTSPLLYNPSTSVLSCTTVTASLNGTANLATNISLGTGGDLLYQSGSNATAKLAIGTVNQVLTSNGSIPSWTTLATPNLSQVLASGNSAGSSDINMNSQNITNATSITAVNFNGTATNADNLLTTDTNTETMFLLGSNNSATNTGSIYKTTSSGGFGLYYLPSSGSLWTSNISVYEYGNSVNRGSISVNSGVLEIYNNGNPTPTITRFLNNNSAGTQRTVLTLNGNAGTSTFDGTAILATNISLGTAGDLLYQSGSNATAKLAIGANTYVLTSNGSIPTWSPPSTAVIPTLSQVLVAGNTAGSTNIDMNTQNITNATSITATTFSGSLSGTATNANNVNITVDNSATIFYPIFAAGSGYNSLLCDTTTTALTYNPGTGELLCPNITDITKAITGFSYSAGPDKTTIANNVQISFDLTVLGSLLCTQLETTYIYSSSPFVIETLNVGDSIQFKPESTLVMDVNVTEVDFYKPINLNAQNIIGGGTITATTFIGDLSGSVTTIALTSDDSATTCYIPFSKTTSGTSNALFIDNTTTPLRYRPDTGEVSAQRVTVGGILNPSAGDIATRFLQFTGANAVFEIRNQATSGRIRLVALDALNTAENVLTLSTSEFTTITSTNPTITGFTAPPTTDTTAKIATTSWVQSALTSGVATATTIQVTENNTANTYYPVFCTGASGQKSLLLDSATSPLSYQPSTGTLSALVLTVGTSPNSSYINQSSNVTQYVNNGTSSQHRFYINDATPTQINPFTIASNAITSSVPFAVSGTSASVTTYTNAGGGTNNPMVVAADNTIVGSGAGIGLKTLTVTVWSNTNSGVRINPTSLLIGSGGVVGPTPTNNILFDGSANTLTLTSSSCPTQTGYTVPAAADSTSKIATTQWVQSALTSGVATATTVNVQVNNTSTTMYPIFCTATAGQKSLLFDTTSTALSYTPSTSTLRANVFSIDALGRYELPTTIPSSLTAVGSDIFFTNDNVGGAIDFSIATSGLTNSFFAIREASTTIKNPTLIVSYASGTSSTRALEISDSAGVGVSVVPNSTVGSYNPLIAVNDSVIFGDNAAIDTSDLVLTTWSSTTTGVRINSTSALIGAGGTTATPTSSISCSGTTVTVTGNPVVTNRNILLNNGSGAPITVGNGASTATGNTIMASLSLATTRDFTTGGNTIIGYVAGNALVVASARNTIIGDSAGTSATGSNNTVIGYNAQVPTAANSNQIAIGTASETMYIRGGFNWRVGTPITASITLTAPLPQFVTVTMAAASQTITLPAPNNTTLLGATIIFKRKTNTTAFTIAAGAGTPFIPIASITAAATIAVTAIIFQVTLVCDGTNWCSISNA